MKAMESMRAAPRISLGSDDDPLEVLEDSETDLNHDEMLVKLWCMLDVDQRGSLGKAPFLQLMRGISDFDREASLSLYDDLYREFGGGQTSAWFDFEFFLQLLTTEMGFQVSESRLLHAISIVGEQRLSGTFAAVREVVAGPEVKKIGVSFTAQPPAPVFVKMCEPGSWSEASGLQAGDQILQLDGVCPKSMTVDIFRGIMKKRPLCLQVRNASGFTAGESVKDLGLEFGSGPPDLTVVDAVAKGSWAENVGIHVGDVVTQIDSTLVRDIVDSDLGEAFEKRPIHLLVIPAAAFKKSSLATMRSPDEIKHLLSKVTHVKTLNDQVDAPEKNVARTPSCKKAARLLKDGLRNGEIARLLKEAAQVSAPKAVVPPEDEEDEFEF